MDMIAPTKEAMEQYECLKMELESVKKEVKETEDSISKLIEEGTVCDKVTGGLGGIQGFKIEGFPMHDRSNLYSSCEKSFLDALQQEKSIANDGWNDVYDSEFHTYLDPINPRVVVEIEEMGFNE